MPREQIPINKDLVAWASRCNVIDAGSAIGGVSALGSKTRGGVI
jgi:hypothetical protein